MPTYIKVVTFLDVYCDSTCNGAVSTTDRGPCVILSGWELLRRKESVCAPESVHRVSACEHNLDLLFPLLPI